MYRKNKERVVHLFTTTKCLRLLFHPIGFCLECYCYFYPIRFCLGVKLSQIVYVLQLNTFERYGTLPKSTSLGPAVYKRAGHKTHVRKGSLPAGTLETLREGERYDKHIKKIYIVFIPALPLCKYKV